MKLRNKKTGEIKEVEPITIGGFRSLAELNEEWEDYEEPKEYWFISTTGEVHRFEGEDKTYTPGRKQLGNYFETKEEAEKAVEKLKAWKRLKDKGFRFNCWYGGSKDISFSIPQEIIDGTTAKDLDLLFGGEE